jgi:hypothetical protein
MEQEGQMSEKKPFDEAIELLQPEVGKSKDQIEYWSNRTQQFLNAIRWLETMDIYAKNQCDDIASFLIETAQDITKILFGGEKENEKERST